MREGEQLEDLQLASLFILQKKSGFRFGFDAVALADFASIRPHDSVVDLGTGTGILPLLLFGREKTATFDALEIQPEMADMAARSVRGNGLDAQIRVQCGDLRDIRAYLPHAAASLVVCNPPYWKAAEGEAPKDAARQLSMQEMTCTLEDVTQAAAWLLRYGGRMCLCLPAKRLSEALASLNAQKIEPKRLRFVHSAIDRPARLLLLEGMRGGRPGLDVLPPLVVRLQNGQESPEILKMYHRNPNEEK